MNQIPIIQITPPIVFPSIDPHYNGRVQVPCSRNSNSAVPVLSLQHQPQPLSIHQHWTGAASRMRGLHFCPSRQASWTQITTYRHGRVKIAAAGRESGAAQKQAMLSSSILGAWIQKKIGGEISYSLVNLQQLRYLDLSYNDFFGGANTRVSWFHVES